MVFTFTSALWLYTGDAPWHFITLPADIADEIDDSAATVRRGFGSVRVSVTIGTTTWDTSIFPDKKAGSFVLPVKKKVRDQENLVEGDDVTVAVRLIGI